MAKEFIFFNPHFSEILVVVGSLGVVLAAYKVLDMLFGVSEVSDTH